VGSLINVIEVAAVYAEKKRKCTNALEEVRMVRGVLRCDSACFHGARIIAPFGQINEDSGTRDICVAFPQVASRLEAKKKISF